MCMKYASTIPQHAYCYHNPESTQAPKPCYHFCNIQQEWDKLQMKVEQMGVFTAQHKGTVEKLIY